MGMIKIKPNYTKRNLLAGTTCDIQCVPKKVPFRNHSIVIKRALLCLWEFILASKTYNIQNADNHRG